MAPCNRASAACGRLWLPDGNEKSDHDVFQETRVVQLNISDMAADAASTAFMLMMLP